jgi:arabinan endo-1,5-alpha-L-arabinosidase
MNQINSGNVAVFAIKFILQLIGFFLIAEVLYAQPPAAIPAHDPALIKQNSTYYLFSTGFGINVSASQDLKHWVHCSPVFAVAPAWATNAIPGFKGHIWAPDISFHYGKYYLYYSLSAFGKNTSCIGVAVNKTLDSSSADFKWVDLGKVIQSVPGRDLWNAIDPNLVIDEDNTAWLTFGSFWSGIKMVKLNSAMNAPQQPEEWYTIARRPRDFSYADSTAGNAAIEAPFFFKKDQFYYLFVSWDYCCRGEKSNYKVVVGRSKKVTGPYLDKEGVSMFAGGGTVVVKGDGKTWYGAGHNSVYTFDGKDYNIYHGYDAKDNGKSKLVVDELNWADGWPVSISSP